MPKKTKETKKEMNDQKTKSLQRSSRRYVVSGRKLAEAYFNYHLIRKEELGKDIPELSHIDIKKAVSEEWKLMPIEEQEKYIRRSEQEVVLNDPTQTQKEEQPVVSGVNSLQPEAPHKLPMCGLHKEEYKYWCKNCSEWICEFCVTTHSSNAHSCIHLLDFAQGSLLSDVDALFKQTKASNEVSGHISDELVRIVTTLKKLIETYNNKIKELNITVNDIEHKNKRYKEIWQSFEDDLKEIKESTPTLIANRNLVTTYEYLTRIDDMKRFTQTDNFDIKLLTSIRTQLEEYIAKMTDPLNAILSNIEELIKALTFS